MLLFAKRMIVIPTIIEFREQYSAAVEEEKHNLQEIRNARTLAMFEFLFRRYAEQMQTRSFLLFQLFSCMMQR